MAHSSKLPRLGVNIDHVATLRQLRGTPYPSITQAAEMATEGGAEQITIHLREDRRHIQDRDVIALKKSLKIPMNLEMAVTSEMEKIALKIRPEWVCLVPEKRQEVTTEGGLNVKKAAQKLKLMIPRLQKKGIKVSLFIEPSLEDVKTSHTLGANAVELHTGKYCLARQKAFGGKSSAIAKKEKSRIIAAAELAGKLGIGRHAGHGFDYENVREIAAMTLSSNPEFPLIEEYNIGHAMICRAVEVGLVRATREMVSAICAP